MKKIAFMHYHLRTGGVTTVLRQQVEALKDECKILLLTGEPPESAFPAEFVHIPELGYVNETSEQDFNPAQASESIIRAINHKFKGECDLIHVHNPLLAKNINLLNLLKCIQKNGIKLFLQVHDFAEDGRPAVYYQQDEYPENSHYGVINKRDYAILLNAGLKKEGLHLISNIVGGFEQRRPEISPGNIVLYPVRAIRRKNIGEALLLSIFFKQKETLVITLPPTGPLDLKSYTGWKAFVKNNRLDVEFEAGLKKSFPELVQSARFILTTSISEGFGFSFLEPWTRKKAVWGRKLPGICCGFEDNGIDLGHLYSRLSVPLSWIDRENLCQRFKSAIRKNANIYKNRAYDEKSAESCKKIISKQNIDFGLLDESFQKNIIRRVLASREDAERLLLLNPDMILPGELFEEKRLLETNRNAVENCYNMAAYKENLLRIYSAVINNRVRHKIDRGILLKSFLNPDELSLLKWGDYAE